MHPVSVPVPSGHLFTIIHAPPEDKEVRGWILHIPAFCEEMNKSRPMVRMGAEALSNLGFVVVIPDLFGTGDSDGELGDADWQGWRTDLEHLVDWLSEAGATDITLWGLRLGCLMAAELSLTCSLPVRQLLLWQPVHDGRQFVNQFLRLRIASSMLDGRTETVKSLWHELSDRGQLHVAGYPLSEPLLTQVASLKLTTFTPPASICVDWFDISENDRSSNSPVVEKLAALWRGSGVKLSIHRITGAKFWATQEISYAPELIEQTADKLGDSSEYGTRVSTSSLANQIRKVTQSSPRSETGVSFSCQGSQLIGVHHATQGLSTKGVVIVVGGPQYRVGSHRLFVQLARRLADAGLPVLRFDYRGMGDSEGNFAGFEHIQNDINCAVDAFAALEPSVNQIVLLGLCDAATAASFYAPSDDRVSGMVLMNPWVWSEEGQARTLLKYYYLRRIFNRGLWRKVFSGKFNPGKSIKDLMNNLSKAGKRQNDDETRHPPEEKKMPSSGYSGEKSAGGPNLAARLEESLTHFKGSLLLVLSGKDLTADQFRQSLSGSKRLRKILSGRNITCYDIPDADHTFSAKELKLELGNTIVDWMQAQ